MPNARSTPLPIPHLHTLPNGVALVCLPMPQAPITSVSLFVRSGSAHEASRVAGISHVLEHMVFKGSATRDCRQINLDAERLGGEVNAHTDRDHTAFHLRGLPEHAADFVRMLADIVLTARFPEDELQREREVVLQEFAEDEDDPVSAAYRLVDACCFGKHPAARPIIGTRRGIQAITRADLVALREAQYTGANMVLAMAGPMKPEALRRLAEPLFAHLPTGQPNRLPPATYLGGQRHKAMPGSSQSHAVLAFGAPARPADELAPALAAAVLGEGMSSPLLDELRERRGLVYYAACHTDTQDFSGQFMLEASTSPAQLPEALRTMGQLLARHAERVDPQDLERARNQLLVRRLQAAERPQRLLEAAVLDWLSLGRVRPFDEDVARLHALGVNEVRDTFARLLAPGATVAVTGRVPRGLKDQLAGWLAVPLAPQA